MDDVVSKLLKESENTLREALRAEAMGQPTTGLPPQSPSPIQVKNAGAVTTTGAIHIGTQTFS